MSVDKNKCFSGVGAGDRKVGGLVFSGFRKSESPDPS